MPVRRKLTLKRDVLHELGPDDLRAVGAGTVDPTYFSCLDYISCFPWQCLPTFDERCIN